jgi:uncharacterized membrane protein
MRLSEHLVFQIGLVVKGLDALGEIVGGTLLLMPTWVSHEVLRLSERETAKHPHLAIGEALERAGISVLSVTVGGAIYLIGHGLAKAILICGAMKEQVWGFVGLIGVLSIFAVIEGAEFFVKHSLVMLSLAFFDTFIVVLIAREWRRRAQLEEEPKPEG